MLPAFAPFPPGDVRRHISRDDWDSFLDCWILLVQRYLLLSPKEFSVRVQKDPSVVDFIYSYVTESARARTFVTNNDEKEKRLKREIFLLVHRIFTVVIPIPQKLQQHDFLGDLCILCGRLKALPSLLELLWDRRIFNENASMQENKTSLIQSLNSGLQGRAVETDETLERMAALLKVSFHYGQFLMLGSDFLDALATAFEKSPSAYQSKLVVAGYLGLTSLLESRRPKVSTLLDHLYSLQSSLNSKSFIQALSSSTPLLRRLRENLVGQDIDRARPLMQELETFEKAATGLPGHQILRKHRKGKDRASPAPAHDMYIHQMSLVTQIQDLFPDLGSSFIVKLLAEYEDDTEQVVAHLLEDSLPAHLKEADRGEVLSSHPVKSPSDLHNHENIPLRTRRNIHDNDAFDRLAVPTSSIRQGRQTTPEATLPQRPSPSAKAAILSALAAFDSDSDERDDTYDATDVGGTVDSVAQMELAGSAYRSRAADSSSEDSDDDDDNDAGDPSNSWQARGGSESGRGRGQGRGRGGGRGRGRGRGGGGDVAGPANERSTQVARQRKDAHKGSRANHNRRDQHARKMARGGMMPG